MSKIAQVKLPKIAPAPQVPAPPKRQQSIQSQIYRDNREAMRAVPMTPQRYPNFMGKTGWGGRTY